MSIISKLHSFHPPSDIRHRHQQNECTKSRKFIILFFFCSVWMRRRQKVENLMERQRQNQTTSKQARKFLTNSSSLVVESTWVSRKGKKEEIKFIDIMKCVSFRADERASRKKFKKYFSSDKKAIFRCNLFSSHD